MWNQSSIRSLFTWNQDNRFANEAFDIFFKSEYAGFFSKFNETRLSVRAYLSSVADNIHKVLESNSQ
jgi:hypothetical protein